jgi:hypothetical protein
MWRSMSCPCDCGESNLCARALKILCAAGHSVNRFMAEPVSGSEGEVGASKVLDTKYFA